MGPEDKEKTGRKQGREGRRKRMKVMKERKKRKYRKEGKTYRESERRKDGKH